MSDASSSYLPFLTIWIHPRSTIRSIVDSDPTRLVLVLGALSGVARFLDTAVGRSLGDVLPVGTILLLLLTVAPVLGILGLFIGGWIIRLTGSWLGGVANSTQVRAALAWGSIPQIATVLFVSLPIVLSFGNEAFTTATPRTDSLAASSPIYAVLFGVVGFLMLAAGIVFGLWSLVVLLKCVGEVHRFSALRALLAILLPAFILVFLALFIVFLAT